MQEGLYAARRTKEIKDHEYRVGVTPDGVRTLREAGHEILVEASAGLGSGFTDEDYRQAGARTAASKEDVFRQAVLIVKVKEPQLSECPLFRPGQLLFTYLHLASAPELTKTTAAARVTALAYETTEGQGRSSMLRPMSEIAGRLSVQIGARFSNVHRADVVCYLPAYPVSSRRIPSSLAQELLGVPQLGLPSEWELV